MIARSLIIAAAAAAGIAAALHESDGHATPAVTIVADNTAPAAATITFAGRITSVGQPVAGATIRIMPWGAEGRTDLDGRYTIAVKDAKVGDAAILRVSGQGFADVTRTITATGGTVTVDVELSGAPSRNEQESKSSLTEAVGIVGDVRERRAVPPGTPQAATLGAGQAVRYRAANVRPDAARYADPDFNTENYAGFDDNPFLAAGTNPLSTFSIDVDRASYANVRRFLNDGRLPPRDAVRIEELVNYFSYDDPAPDSDAETPFSITTELATAPWRPEHHLLRVALKARSIDMRDAPASNLVFLLDVSGSMNSPDKLPLLKQAFGLLVNELRPRDRVAIVVYAGAAGVVLPSTEGSEKERILEAIERLEAGGSTAGGAGIKLAYDIARQHHISGGNNRVILATDGDFNVGASSDAEMMRLVEDRRRQGTFLTVLGFGTGNLKDSKMETLADHGNGNYAYIDSLLEARKTLIEEIGGTLLTIAKDVKIQVEFNPDAVRGYRLIGYENRLLAAEDFNDDARDAGELGAGHSVTALYEVVTNDATSDVTIRGTDALRYQNPPTTRSTSGNREIAFVKLRWKQPDGDSSSLIERPVPARTTSPSHNFRFAAAVAAFGMLLRESEHAGNTSWDSVHSWAANALGNDPGQYRAGFLDLVERARHLSQPIATRH